MSNTDFLRNRSIAISISQSPDMSSLGLGEAHLRDAMAEIARHLLAVGARLAYGGDLRTLGFTDLLFELVSRHRRDVAPEDNGVGAVNYLAWPVHIAMSLSELESVCEDMEGAAALSFLKLDGSEMSLETRRQLSKQVPTETQWVQGLTTMRLAMRRMTIGRIVLGGSVNGYHGTMPGIAEEALLTLQAGQPLFLLGGFGGCARDIANALGLLPNVAARDWPGIDAFSRFDRSSLSNGLSRFENEVLATTPHVDQAISLVLRGLYKTGSRRVQAVIN